MNNISPQLQKSQFRFDLLKPKSKVPFELKWQTENNYSYDDPKLLKHINSGGNVGLVTGHGNVVVIDFDNIDVQNKIVPKLPKTFTTLTGTKKLHKYFICKDGENLKILDDAKDSIADIQFKSKQVVIPPSVHPNGTAYTVFDNSSIAGISMGEIKALFSEWKKPEQSQVPSNKDQENELIKQKISMPKLLSDYGIDTSRNPTRCPLHNSKGGKCLSFNDELCNCFHCEELKGDIFSVVQILDKCDFPAAKNKLAKMAGVELKKVNSNKLSNYVFDENEVVRQKVFSLCKLNNETLGIGILLPYNKQVLSKSNEKLGIKQIQTPVILTSNNQMLEMGMRLEEDHKIQFSAIPGRFERRMSLSTIKKFLRKEHGKIDGTKLFIKIRRIYKKYLYFNNPVWYSIHALWDIGTYFFLLFQVYPILELRGIRGSAKTKTMSASGFLTFNATEIMINPSESAMFRETHEKRPTKYVDEAEKLFRIEKGRVIPDQRAELINASYYYKGTVPRVEKIGNKFVTVYYSVYSPTMIGSINGLYGATEDRALIHITTKAPADDPRGSLEPLENSEEWQKIRDELYLFLLQDWSKVEETYNTLENETNLKNRDFAIWKPILTLAKLLDSDTYMEIKKYSNQVYEMKRFDFIPEESFEFEVLSFLKDFVNDDRDFVFLKEVSEKFIPERKITNKRVAKTIDKFGFDTYKTRKHLGEKTGYGYQISKNIFEKLVMPICPSLFSSPPSPPSHTDDNDKQKRELNANLVKQERERSEPSESGERSTELKEYK